MSNIKIFALGGLGENGKNLYCVEVDKQIFVLEAGSKNPPAEMYGVDSIIPSIKYLIKNKSRIKGIFISHGHEDKLGAIPEFLNHIKPNIYASRFTMNILKDYFNESDLAYYDRHFHIVDKNTVLEFEEVKVSFFRTTHSIPESLGIAIHTPDGVIVYTGDYSFNTHIKKSYKTSFDKIATLGEENVLCLLSDSIGTTYQSTGDSNYLLEHDIKDILKTPGRVLISAFSSELDKIQMAIDVALEYDRRIAIIGRKAQRIIDISVNLGYLKIPKDKLVNLRFIDSKNDNYADDMVVLVTGDKHEPYFMMQRIARKRDKLIHLDKRDKVLVMTIPLPGVERMAANTIDTLYKSGAYIKIVNRKVLRGAHASVHDTKMLYNLLSPKYVMPVLGEYRHQYAHLEAAKSYGYSDDSIIMADNGDVYTFVDGVRQDKVGSVEVGEVLVDGSLVGDINEIVLRDRETLARDGVIMAIGNIDARKRELVSEVEVVSQGFVLEKEEPELFKEIKTVFEKVAKSHFSDRYMDWNVIKQEIRDEMYKAIIKHTNRRTLIIPVIIDTIT